MSLNDLPPTARLWLLAFPVPPDPAVEARFREGLDDLLARWRHKGEVYQAAWTFLEPQLAAIAEPTLAARPSGCAIDGMLRRVKGLAAQSGLDLVDPDGSLLVRRNHRLEAIPKARIQACLDTGVLDAATPVLDLSLYSLDDLRSGRLERPLGETWVARSYRIPQPHG